jgi:hypothetical protein
VVELARDGGAIHDVIVAGLLKEEVQGLALIFVEAGEDLVLGGGERGLRLGQPLGSEGRHVHGVPPSIFARPSALDQALALEFVEEPDQVRAVDLKHVRERVLGAAAMIAEHGQGDEVSRSEAERPED